ncbi:aminotransferase class I and II [Chryseobacterium sp. LC2016-29]|uniref:HipA family kinase n=1 Tax=Chryseobacterium sp. LC2016-29 TaxID=2897331 RepID=UPI001E392D8A|nr:HipA family kinase [Chryseobacterium sp. LC2016-29]MCD0479846.1 aminotransferase class I and II [Chryseobacterium sp. LC2016-29]
MLDLRTVTVQRYILPLREGGSLPALAEADDDFKYVLKFRGAGHGVKMLISELLGGKITEALDLPIPELVFANLDVDFGRTEADEEIQDLLKNSEGLNLGLHYLSESIAFDSSVKIDSLLASKIVWLDAFITNIDRTFKNTNLLMWHKELWIIDNGASFYFHHSWQNFDVAAKTPFKYVKDHVLLPQATKLDEADQFAHSVLNETLFREIVNTIPQDWLHWNDAEENPDEIREVYFNFLKTRLENSQIFVNEAKNARG